MYYELYEYVFQIILQTMVHDLYNDKDTAEIGKYFQDNYTANRKSWAFCYCKNTGINTNMHLERLLCIFKHFYLRGKW